MKFTRRDDYHAVSDCGRYSICRVTVGGQDMLEAWRTGSREAQAVRLAGYGYSGDEVRKMAYRACVKACEGDAG